MPHIAGGSAFYVSQPEQHVSMTRSIQITPASEVLSPQCDFCAEQDSVAFALQPFLKRPHAIVGGFGFVTLKCVHNITNLKRVSPFRRTRHHHSVRRQPPALLTREFDAVGLANKALHRNSRCPRTFNVTFHLFLLVALHHCRHRLWVSLNR